ncbi:hypothetical protein R3P38DRAFT_3443737 [Favolaschia claudopus]|uniref:Uncharacterized protein n=1 Tax=Favolaschia claudopus TaxID=2862362 RepID=A0AAV9ZQP3_9AGAR
MLINASAAPANPQLSSSSTPAGSSFPYPYPPTAAARPHQQDCVPTTPIDAASPASENETDSYSDSAPLATLLPRRRSASALSLSSRLRSAGSLASSSRANPKPKSLVDIAALTAGRVEGRRCRRGWMEMGLRAGDARWWWLSTCLETTGDGEEDGAGPLPVDTFEDREGVPSSSASLWVRSTRDGTGLRVEVGGGGGLGSEDLDHIVKSTPTPTPSLVPADALKTLSSTTTTTTTPSFLPSPHPPPPAFPSSPSLTAAARKTLHRRSSSDIISAYALPKRTWASDIASRYSPRERLISDARRGHPPRQLVRKAEEAGEGHEKEEGDAGDVVPPIVIRQRSPSPAFGVTLRPAGVGRRGVGAGVGGRSESSGLTLPPTTREGAGSDSTVTQPTPALSSSSYATMVVGIDTVSRSGKHGAEDLSPATSVAGSTSPPPPASVLRPLRPMYTSVTRVEREMSQRPRSSTMTPLVHRPQQKTRHRPFEATLCQLLAKHILQACYLALPLIRSVTTNSSLSSTSSILTSSINALAPLLRRPLDPAATAPSSTSPHPSSARANLAPPSLRPVMTTSSLFYNLVKAFSKH